MATRPDVPPPEPLPPLDTPPDPGEVQTTPMPMTLKPFHPAPGALAITLALALGLSACGKEGSSGAASAPGGAAPVAGPAAGASSPASGVTTNGGLPASELGSIATPGGSKNSSPNSSTGNAAR